MHIEPTQTLLADPLWAALDATITRLRQDPPTVLLSKKADFPGGLNAATINALAAEHGLAGGRPVFRSYREDDDQGNEQRFEAISHPDRADVVSWRVWAQVYGAEPVPFAGSASPKLEQALDYLAAWRDKRREQLAEQEVEGSELPDSASEVRTQKTRGQKKPVKLSHWAIGFNAEDGTWRLFQWFGNIRHWAERGQFDMPDGLPERLAKGLAEREGVLDKAGAISLFKTEDRRKWKDKLVFDRTAKQVRQRLATAVQAEIERVANDSPVEGNPIPWVEDAWRCEIQIGYADLDEKGKLRFQTRTQCERDDDNFSGAYCPD